MVYLNSKKSRHGLNDVTCQIHVISLDSHLTRKTQSERMCAKQLNSLIYSDLLFRKISDGQVLAFVVVSVGGLCALVPISVRSSSVKRTKPHESACYGRAESSRERDDENKKRKGLNQITFPAFTHQVIYHDTLSSDIGLLSTYSFDPL